MGSSRSPRQNIEYSTSDILGRIKNAEDVVKLQQYEVDVNSYIQNVLAKFNNRDQDKISEYIDSIKKALNKDIDGTITTRFGGSISKNTHVNGISDIDTLIILNNTDLIDEDPKDVLKYFANKVKAQFPNVEVKKGDTAVTVCFNDMDIQLLPAIKYKTGLKIPDMGQWSNVVKPTIFARQLTVLNQRLEGRLIPAIKVIKGIISQFPENMRLKGYHIENLALHIFNKRNNDDGSRINNKDLITSFFREASKAISVPIKDVSKQSQYVDDYLEGRSSLKRIMVADVLERTFRKLEVADSARLVNVWKDVISIKE